MSNDAILAARLAEAEEALHKLQIGGGVQSLSVDGRSVDYTPAKIADLQAYILDLRVRLGRAPRRVWGATFR